MVCGSIRVTSKSALPSMATGRSPWSFRETLFGSLPGLERLGGVRLVQRSFWLGDLEQARVLRSMERFARDVMPAFREP